jgi:hypothetical protein
MSLEMQHTETGNSPPTSPEARAPRGRPGATLVREAESRTARGATVTVREWWHRAKGHAPYRYVEARSHTLLGEYTTAVRGNAAMVFESFLAGVYDLSTPLGELPAGLGRAMGRAWLKASDGACGRLHVVGGHCSHFEGGKHALQTRMNSGDRDATTHQEAV